jgi:hypothetical protein
MVTPLVKHKIVKKRTNRFNRYQSDRKVTVKVRDAGSPGGAMQLEYAVTRSAGMLGRSGVPDDARRHRGDIRVIGSSRGVWT